MIESTIGKSNYRQCGYCGNWHTYSDEMCRDLTNRPVSHIIVDFNADNMTQLKERHEREIKIFQDNCCHSSISDWVGYYWAPGHFSHYVKTCNRCHKIVEEKI